MTSTSVSQEEEEIVIQVATAHQTFSSPARAKNTLTTAPSVKEQRREKRRDCVGEMSSQIGSENSRIATGSCAGGVGGGEKQKDTSSEKCTEIASGTTGSDSRKNSASSASSSDGASSSGSRNLTAAEAQGTADSSDAVVVPAKKSCRRVLTLSEDEEDVVRVNTGKF